MNEFKPATELFEAVTYDQIMEPVSEQIGIVREQWADVGKEEIIKRMPDLTTQSSHDRAQSVAIVNPTDSDGKPKEIDETSTVVLGMPYANGWTPHHFIRTKILQEVVTPNSRVIAIPNNGWGQKNYNFTDSDKIYNFGAMDSLASATAGTLREIGKETHLGFLSLTGYSQAGKMVLKLASRLRGDFGIERINVDEAVSKVGRGVLGVIYDFTKSGNDYPGAVEQSELPALSAVMSAKALAVDMARSPFVQLKRENRKLLSEGLTGSIDSSLYDAISGSPNNIANIKIGYFASSKMFDPASVDYYSANRCGYGNLRHYVGDGFKGHASADDVFLHAAMVNDGFKIQR